MSTIFCWSRKLGSCDKRA